MTETVATQRQKNSQRHFDVSLGVYKTLRGAPETLLSSHAGNCDAGRDAGDVLQDQQGYRPKVLAGNPPSER
jgi:hypothetical protein